jgi:hypothetical protein
MTSWAKDFPPVGIPLERGRVTVLTLKHDAWCPTVNGGTGADCLCDPDVVVTLVPRKPEG